MDSIELGRLERRARVAYEWARIRRALWGFGPALLVVALAAGVSKRPSSALLFGSMMFGLGVLLLWYGRDLRRAVLPGFAFGLLPLALALCANHLGHVCTGDACYSLCVPACSAGGLGAGLGVSYLGRRTEHGFGFWGAAAALSLLTGAMGCSCVGWGGVAGLVAGYVVGLVPMVARRLRLG